MAMAAQRYKWPLQKCLELRPFFILGNETEIVSNGNLCLVFREIRPIPHRGLETSSIAQTMWDLSNDEFRDILASAAHFREPTLILRIGSMFVTALTAIFTSLLLFLLFLLLFLFLCVCFF